MSPDIQSEYHGQQQSPDAGSSATLPSQPSTIPLSTVSELTQNQAEVATDVPALVPEDFFNSSSDNEPDLHDPTGTSILEAGSILNRNGRTYQAYREGKYFLPNDPVNFLRSSSSCADVHVTHITPSPLLTSSRQNKIAWIFSI
jgi:hypothetical protein